MVSRDYMRHDFEGGGFHRSFWATIPGTKALLIALAAVHLVVIVSLRSFGPELYYFLSLDPEAVLRKFHIWQLVTATLVHDPTSVWHILFNCIVLWFFGRTVETRLGTKKFLIFCGAAALTASLAYLLIAVLESDVTPMVGASGACMGLLVLVALWEPNTIIYFMFFLRMPLWVVAIILIFMDLVGAISAGAGGVAHTAHLGGTLYGWLYFRYGGGLEKVFSAIDRYADKQKEKRDHARAERDAEMRKEVDRILDKVNREGMAALSDAEKRFLRDASGKLRK